MITQEDEPRDGRETYYTRVDVTLCSISPEAAIENRNAPVIRLVAIKGRDAGEERRALFASAQRGLAQWTDPMMPHEADQTASFIRKDLIEADILHQMLGHPPMRIMKMIEAQIDEARNSAILRMGRALFAALEQKRDWVDLCAATSWQEAIHECLEATGRSAADLLPEGEKQDSEQVRLRMSTALREIATRSGGGMPEVSPD